MTMKNTAFWFGTLYTSEKYRRFEGTNGLHFLSPRVNQSSNQQEANNVMGFLNGCLTYSFTPMMEAIRSTETSVNVRITGRHPQSIFFL
jgi:hypothetical protein